MSVQIENLIKKLKTRKSKNIIYLLVLISLVGWFGYRFYVVANERNTDVFNIVRNDVEYGIPVQTIPVQEKDDVLYEPITIKDNITYVSSARINMFRVGQNLGNCKINYISKNLDLYTGMHVIKTSNCDDGLHYAQITEHGFFIPVFAVHGNVVYIAESGVARERIIEIAGRDLQNILIKTGLKNGDNIILSNVKNNQKIRTIK